ncbi:MAG: hypothetical protein JXQ71_10955 [Verrucomicrobia bacterium]|nr:hypothetical protein [Verrucomicrobiota bacterium]
MRLIRLLTTGALAALMGLARLGAQTQSSLPGTEALDWTGDLSARMVAGIAVFLQQEIDCSAAQRERFWRRDYSSPAAYADSVASNRERFRAIIGAVDPRVPVTALDYVQTTARPAAVAATESYTVYAVRWPVFEGVHGDGLWLKPKTGIGVGVVAIPDADQTPEMLAGLAPGMAAEHQFARRLAENGCQVLVLSLVDRSDTWSGNARLGRFTNQPHREWIYRQAYELGRHIIGYEAQKVLAAVDWLARFGDLRSTADGPRAGGGAPGVRIGVAGYGEGGLIAFYAAALDPRIHAALVSGYFGSRQEVWKEPIYRNVFGLLREFGDAEIASLIAPRPLIIEHSRTPVVSGPPEPRGGRRGAAPGVWATPDFNRAEIEVKRAERLVQGFGRPFIDHVYGNEGMPLGPGSDPALRTFLAALGDSDPALVPSGAAPVDSRRAHDPGERQRSQVAELVEHTQRLLRQSETVRARHFWSPIRARSAAEWQTAVGPLKAAFWDEVLGRFPKASLPAHARTRRIHDRSRWTGYEVVLDVWPDVFAWGVLLLPKDLRPGERRPVVVCQHGLEGLPADTLADPQARGYGAYKAFAARLAERGFVVFAPHNPYRGGDRFRVLQRQANVLGRSLFSVILAQHDRILDWLGEQRFVDPGRIGFYGLSYGGKTAMRVPALLDRYCLSICSADFNEWVRKNASVDSPYSYLFTGEYEMPEWNLGHTFNYAEMAALIAPRPFMVERGHQDGVAPDEWVAYEYAKVRRFYAQLGIADRTAIEFFDGPHTIHGVGTYAFLHRHLDWPMAEPQP